MRCEQAQQLFDAYLDGELSLSMRTELGAHRLRCADCRRALALLEVSGHVIESDVEPAVLRNDFTDRLLACVQPHMESRFTRVRRWIYVGGPLAAAAVIALAFVGVFDRGNGKVAGVKLLAPNASTEIKSAEVPALPDAAEGRTVTEVDPVDVAAQRALDEWLSQTQSNLERKGESVRSLQHYFRQTILQQLDILDSRKTAGEETHFPGSDELVPDSEEDRADPAAKKDTP